MNITSFATLMRCMYLNRSSWYRSNSRMILNSRSSLTRRNRRRSLKSLKSCPVPSSSAFGGHPSTSMEHPSVPSVALSARSTGRHANRSIVNHVLK